MSRINHLSIIIQVVLLASISFAQENISTSDVEIDANAPQSEITVQDGDTLWAIALRFDTTVEDLKLANNLVSPKLKIGTVLKLPNGSNSSPESYIVQDGDTLFDIALAFSLTVDDLIVFNNISGSTIKPGQELMLYPPSAAPPVLRVKVVNGDTLWAISRKYDIAVVDLISANNLGSDKLSIGLELIIPGRYPTLEANGNPNPDIGGAAPLLIKVAKGDTLWEIAHRYHTDISALMVANNLPSSEIKAGQTLRIISGGELARAKTEVAETNILASVAKPVVGMESVSTTLNLMPRMVWPLRGQITSKFGYRLLFGNSNYHTGLDIDGITGDPIVAAVAGKVNFAGTRGGYGKLVVIEAAQDRLYYYGHCSELLVQKGDEVALGQVIAKVGNTGRSTGSHLHFEIRENGQAVDPLIKLEQNAVSP